MLLTFFLLAVRPLPFLQKEVGPTDAACSLQFPVLAFPNVDPSRQQGEPNRSPTYPKRLDTLLVVSLTSCQTRRDMVRHQRLVLAYAPQLLLVQR